MNVITKEEERAFLALFNRNGYVLNFTDSSFDVFTTSSVGVAIKTKYNLSKAKSLIKYLDSASQEDKQKIICDLFHFYEENMKYEYNKDYDDFYYDRSSSRYNEYYAKIYEICKIVIDRLKGSTAAITKTANNLKSKFSSDYLSKQIEMMVTMQTTNPTNAIGIAKELIESCCKTILDDLGIEWDKKDDIPKLTNKAMDALNLLPTNIEETDQGAKAIKAILGNLRSISYNLAEIRNPFGSGHGKSSSFQGLEERHAKLAVGSSITFVDFLWGTFENQKKHK